MPTKFCGPVTSELLIFTFPVVGFIKPDKIFINVDFPHPEGPTTAEKEPDLIFISSPDTANKLFIS